MTDEYLRVRATDTGHEFTIRSEQFDKAAHEKVDSPALDHHGEQKPAKYKTTAAKKAADNKAAKSVSSEGN